MKDFDSRWNAALEAARPAKSESAGSSGLDAAPYGFAARLVALSAKSHHASSSATLWLVLTWRAIGFAALLLVASAALSYSLSGGSPLQPDIVDSMDEVLW